MSVISILLVPLIAAALAGLPLKKNRAAAVTVASSSLVLVLAAHLAWRISKGATVTAGTGQWMAVDGLGALILLLIALVATTASIFSVGYMAHRNLTPARLRIYNVNFNLFVFSMLAIPVLTEPTLVWIVVELTTLSSALLVSFDNTRQALEAAWKYVVLSLMGAGIALFGFLVLFAAMQAAGGEGPYTWSGLIAAAPHMPPVMLQMAFLLILIGLGTKVGLVPMHTWLPDAHSQAPSPVCALLSGIETTTILYVILRLFPVMRAAPGAHAEEWAVVLGLISVGTAAFLLLQVHDYKRMFAYSTVEHMGIVLTAVGLGAATAGYGAMQQIVTHCVSKSFCFFAAGAALLAVETRRIDAVRGLIHRSPAAGAALVFGGLAITGAPPLAVFLSELSILRAGLLQRHYVATLLLAVFIVIAFFGIMLHINRMVFGVGERGTPESDQLTPEESEGGVDAGTRPTERFRLPLSCRLALIMAGAPVLVLGFYVPKQLHDLLAQAAAVLTK